MKLINPKYLQKPDEAAVYLLGCVIKRQLPDGTVLTAKIVETESYHQEDAASHTFGGLSARNKAMFGPAGFAYIYFTYGMHWCFNVTAGADGYGAGVLIRAAEPLTGFNTMRQFRRQTEAKQLCNGPAKLAQALAIDKNLYGHNLTKPPLQLFEPKQQNFSVTRSTRVGISKNADVLARFYIAGSPYISRT